MKVFNLSQKSRESETLPIENLANYLSIHMPKFIQSKQLHIEQFSAGASNLTYRLTSGKHSVILRRPPSGTKAASAHDMVREFNVIKSVGTFYSLSPIPLLLCEDENIIGEKFFIMEQIEGLGIDKKLPVDMTRVQIQTLCKNFISGLVQLHEIDISAKELSHLGKPEGYVERQLEGWQKRYKKAKTDDVGSSDDIYQWLKTNLAKNSGYQSLVHNDYKFDNVILDPLNPEKIKGVLDWEMTTLGDPLLDLGCSLAYWINSDDDAGLLAIRMMPTHLNGMMTRQEVFDTYCATRNIQDLNLAPYYVFGLFRLAVIAQQIYYRFYHGQTDNQKFKNFAQLVNILLNKAQQEITLTQGK
ncbi:MAG: aminoglycoside phosphotransferase (APT) family kinase protein [Polaribacter sp.]|jgi:aminoglycoside phosphotransferase (APT) family kinase protein